MQEKPDTARMLAALLVRIFPENETIILSREEIEDAPEIEMKEIFLTDQVELKLKKV
jgi:hypothetical protein